MALVTLPDLNPSDSKTQLDAHAIRKEDGVWVSRSVPSQGKRIPPSDEAPIP